MQVGDIRHIVTIESQGSPTKNAVGEDVEVWSTLATVWAAFLSPTARETIAARGVHAEATTVVVIRYRSDVTRRMRAVTTDGRVLTFGGAVDPDGRKRWLHLPAVEEV